MLPLLTNAICMFYYISSPVVSMRENSDPNSEVVSQAFFSEEVKILERTNKWIKIQTKIDGYPGWVEESSICERKTPFLSDPAAIVARVNRAAAHLYKVQDTIYGPTLTLPFESRIEVLEPKEPSNSRWIKVALPDGQEKFIQRGDVTLNQAPLNIEEMCNLSRQFLGLPYTWGGRSSFGYDCSGFVQMLYRQMGIFLPRDSKDQIRWDGFQEVALKELKLGDLIFFGLEETKIRHVGMYLEEGQFVHSTVAENKPYIRLSHLSDPEWNGSGRFAYVTGRTLKKL